MSQFNNSVTEHLFLPISVNSRSTLALRTRRRSLVHFDGSIRTSTATVITGQALEDIQRVANGENKDESGTWHKLPSNLLAIIQTPLPLVIRYMRTKDIEEWRLLKTFAGVLGEVVQSGVRAVTAPASFAAAFATDWTVPGSTHSGGLSVTEWLAANTQLASSLFRKHLSDPAHRGK